MGKYWIIALVITLTAAYYQRITGPTYPLKPKIAVPAGEISCKLPRSAETSGNKTIEIDVPEGSSGVLKYKRYKTSDEWSEYELVPQNGKLIVILPVQPAAGKLVYTIEVISGGQKYPLTENPVVIRFKDPVPGWALIPHVVLIFFAMLLSNLTGILAMKKKANARKFMFFTIAVLLAGGLIFGPLVQKFAFGEYWTGVPFGWDLTDNKTLIAMLVWLVALFASRKKTSNVWIVVAAVVMLIIFLIPHSMFGSELDYATGTVTQG